MIINEDGLLTIVSEGKRLEVGVMPFKENVSIRKLVNKLNQSLQQFISLDKASEISTFNFVSRSVNEYANFVLELRDLDEQFVDDFEYVQEIYSSFSRFHLFTSEELQDMNKDQIMQCMISHMKEIQTAYSHMKAYLACENSNDIKAYSHRKPGFHRETFVIDTQFKIDVDTNFGYGRSSYFILILSYNGIPIMPFTKVIYHEFANASSYLDYTNDYGIHDNSWRDCFAFVTHEINQFNHGGSQNYIITHIKRSLDDLMYLLNKILITDLIYFIDGQRINNYLDYENRHVVYDYEHLLNNVNPNAVNMDSLKLFLDYYDQIMTRNTSLGDYAFFFKDYVKDIIPSHIKNSDNKYLIDQYVYAVCALLSKRYTQYNSFSINDYHTLTEIGKIIKAIIPNHSTIIYKYSGYELIIYRTSRFIAALTYIEKIEKMKDIVESVYYIRRIKEHSQTLIGQIKEYLQDVSKAIAFKTNELELIKLEVLKKQKQFEESMEFRIHQYLDHFFTHLATLREGFTQLDTKAYEADEIKMIKWLDLSRSYLNQLASITCRQTSEFISVYSNGNEFSDTEWSVGRASRRYESSKSEADQIKLILSIKIIQTWNDIITSMLENSMCFSIIWTIEMSKLQCDRLALLDEIVHQLSTMTSNIMSPLDTIRLYIMHYRAENERCIQIDKEFLTLKKPLDEINNQYRIEEAKLKEMQNQKTLIEDHAKIIRSKISM